MNPRWDMLDEVSRAFVGQRWGVPIWGLAVVAFVVALIGGLWGWQRWTSRGQRAHPMFSFLTLAHQCGLSWRQQWTLFLIARHQGLASPLTLMLSPDTLHHHAGLYQEDISTRRGQRVAGVVSSVEADLFGESQTHRAGS